MFNIIFSIFRGHVFSSNLGHRKWLNQGTNNKNKNLI